MNHSPDYTMPFTSPPPPDEAPLLDWALWYASQGWAVFPCHGKVPITRRGFHDASRDAAQIHSWWAQWPGANIGLPLQAGTVALDSDPRHGGDTTLYDLQQQYGPLPDTLTSQTGGGGEHRLYTTSVPVKNKANIGDGIDVQAVGSYIIVPPSIHPDTGRRYIWDAVYGPDTLGPQPAPAWLETLLAFPVGPEAPARDPQAPISEGQRETTLMALAGAMQRVGASPDAIRSALDAENQRCVPPLDAADLDRMTRSVGRYAPAPRLEVGHAAHGVTGNGATTPPDGENAQDWEGLWTVGLQCTKTGVPLQTMHNMGHILEQHPYWQHPARQFWYDDVHGDTMLGEEVISDEHVTYIGEWMGRATGMHVTNDRMLSRAINARCKRRSRDLLRELLQQLPAWDGVERLEYWLSEYAGSPRTAYSMTVSRLLPVSLIARALEPGCQYRYVVVLCGQENIGKSKLLRHLASPDWYVELSFSLEGKEAHLLIRGIWLAEFGELESLGRTGENRLKSYITMQSDAYVPKFSNRRTQIPRRTIFVGTTNEDEFLKGQTGNTRYLPIECRDMEPDGLLLVRTQLLAEALAYYQAHPQDWWQLGEEAERQAMEAREARREKSVYEDLLASTLLDYASVERQGGGQTTYMVWWDLIAEHLGLEAAQRTQRIRHDVASALRALGWTYSPHREQLTWHGKTLRIRPWRLTE